MALQNTDNFLVSRAGTSHKLAWTDLKTDIGNSLTVNSAFQAIGDPATAVRSIVPLQAEYGIQLPVAGINDYNISGALRYNSVASKIELFNGSQWVTASGNTSFSSAPPSPASEGDIWYDVDEGRSYVYYNDGDSAQWVEMNPSWNGGIPDGKVSPVKLSTGGPNWLSDGSLGVGTASPTQKLDVVGSAVARQSDSTKGAQLSDDGAIEIWRSDSAPFIDFKTSTTEDYDCRIQQSSNGLVFSTGGNGSTSPQAALTSSGYFGVGLTNPSSVLHVQGNTNYTGSTPSSDDYDLNVQSGTAYVGIGQSGGIPAIQGYGAGTSYNLVLAPNAGNVGINETNPIYKLTVSEDIAGSVGGQIGIVNDSAGVGTEVALNLVPNQAGTARAASIKSRQTTSGNYADLGFFTAPSDTPLERMTIAADGKVGVGTTSPDTLLDISSSDNTYVTVQSTANDKNALTYYKTGQAVSSGFYVGLNASEEAMVWQSENNDIRFGANNAEVMRVASTGRVGINETSPDYRLHIKETTTSDNYAFIENTTAGNAGLRIKNSSADFLLLASSTALRFYNSGTGSEAARIDSSGNFKIGNTLPASENISLNADGSASFAGDITTGGNPTAGSADGVRTYASGLVAISRGTGNNALQINATGSSTATAAITTDGRAEFADNVQSDGTFVSNRTGSSSKVFSGTQSGTENVVITAGGTATFAAGVSANYFGATTSSGSYNLYTNAGASSALNTVWGDSGGSQNIKFYSDGRAEFASDVEMTTVATGIILKSPNGTRYRVTVANDGTLVTSAA